MTNSPQNTLSKDRRKEDKKADAIPIKSFVSSAQSQIMRKHSYPSSLKRMPIITTSTSLLSNSSQCLSFPKMKPATQLH
jgi:hypothetical protein